MNIQNPPVLLSRRRKTKRPKAYSRCPQDDEYGSVCDYESILLWNTRWLFAPEWTNEEGVSGLIACAPRDCFVAVAPTAVPPEAFDAVVFDMSDAANSPYVFLMVQYPKSVASWDNWLFNWTMTYRLHSDVPLAVGRVVPRAGARVPEAGWKQPTGEHAPK
ncbi:Protein of unknown function [Gryllus bimaculatus]|nr:Protein of unknown function [Gryllus bimaculatus]